MTLSADEFLRRFLQHVLPRGFHKVRYYGIWHPSAAPLRARLTMALAAPTPPTARAPAERLPASHRDGAMTCPRLGLRVRSVCVLTCPASVTRRRRAPRRPANPVDTPPARGPRSTPAPAHSAAVFDGVPSGPDTSSITASRSAKTP